ncbi:hypothetical protein ABMY35_01100 [Pseudoalteromonas sp. BZB3]|uniref:hypothetical protein n=1 Tax=Pseudoalteromonas sp. BZB3 TaxID=3136670 RepID=UPI0032C3E7D0
MSKISVQPHSNAQLQTPAKFLSILDASHTFIITVPDNGDVVGATGRQYELDNVNYVIVDNPSDDVLEIEFERSNIRITAIADGNVKVVNKLKIDSIDDEVNVKINDEVKVLSRSEVGLGLDSLDDIDIEPQQSKKVINANPNRKELILQNTSANPVEIRVGGVNVGQRNGGIIKAGGALGLSNGAAVYAFNTDQSYSAKLSIIEVLL